MSKEYAKLYPGEIKMDKKTKPEMRVHSQRPGAVDDEGNIQYFTEQAHKEECNVNNIVRKYDKTGVILHVSKFEAQFGDMTGMDFTQMQNKVLHAKDMFKNLPAKIRNEFDNSPAKLLQFMENPENRTKAIELGLIRGDSLAEMDGLGEHVKEKAKEVPSGQSENTEK